MEHWLKTSRKPFVHEEGLLVLDLHKAQKTDRIKELLKECNTAPIFVPVIQPFDISFNAPFKKQVESAALQHIQDNLDDYLNEKITTGDKRDAFS